MKINLSPGEIKQAVRRTGELFRADYKDTVHKDDPRWKLYLLGYLEATNGLPCVDPENDFEVDERLAKYKAALKADAG